MTSTVVDAPVAAQTHTVILHPDRDRPARNSPYRFPYNNQTPKAAKEGRVEMSLGGDFLTPGPNFLSDEDYNGMKTNPFWDRCLKRGIIEVIAPLETNRNTGTTVDFEASDASLLIETTQDIEWLKRSLNKDERPDIQNFLVERIKDLEAEIAPQQ